MFESLSDRLTETLGRLGRKGRLTEDDVKEAMREVRRALLEADVNFKVTKDFVAAVQERAIGQDVLRSLTPAQTAIGIVHDELIAVLGAEREPLRIPERPPQIVMMVGLQGSGKTTHTGKLALHLRKENRNPLMVAADVYRPAAVNQLQALGKQVNIPVYDEGTTANPVDIATNAVRFARERGFNPIIVDTAGRLQIDERLMQELVDIRDKIKPTEILLVADAMTGQEAVGVAQAFNDRLGVTGLILTKMDGDARGGAALSIRAVTGVPIKFIGTGEKLDALEPFYPERLASRILGMGDILSLVERAQEQTDEGEAERLQDKMFKGQFDLEDFLAQLQKIKKMGPLTELLGMIPGLGAQLRQAKAEINDDDYKRIEAIIRSMTPKERRRPDIIQFSRRKRIARGSGTDAQEVGQLLTQFKEMQKMMGQFGAMAKKGKLPDLDGLEFGAPGMPQLPGHLNAPNRPARRPNPKKAKRRR
ncbi:MAG: Signal recognition particle protein Ffh [uncultured Thermomicrobiales bacterium]|uniref:Signal recognition particle protein n=1 Tax=uncultured Thermomicrobiales bacterium TaxID=1645740 RepID=A0A6J4TWJ5_9BACT|nr:MAG: Signal recognition particle protein Ffh [uncultured Thermomicrobiales bacterium]